MIANTFVALGLKVVGHPDDGGKGGECACGAVHLARHSPAEGGDSEIGGDGDGVVIGQKSSQPLPSGGRGYGSSGARTALLRSSRPEGTGGVCGFWVLEYVIGDGGAQDDSGSPHGLVRGLPDLKFEKDHLCSACSMGKSKKKPHKPKSEDTNKEKLYLLHMDLCGPMPIASVNGNKYILVIVDDYSRFTWVNFLRIDNGTEFVNQTLREYYEKVGISHKTFVARSPQQNGVIERRNHTLIKAARTMLIYAKASLFLWAEAVATACYTQNRSIIRLRHGKTPYELLHDKLPDLSFFHVFGALCYPTNDSENLGKLQPKVDIGYAPTKKAFRIYNRRTRRIIETIHVDFDELTVMAFEHSSSGPVLHEITPAIISSGLVYHRQEQIGIFCFNRCLMNYSLFHPMLITQPLKSLLQFMK
ncbi:retrovirus-related pol polyprotein from transposon TNT 1-94 [Tanacetum coccineum]